jgi:predicted transcriptional regulator of viral defense system
MKHISSEYPEIDALQLQERLKNYAYPRDRITKLLARGDLVRIKKGIYIDPHSPHPYSKEILANLLYGPSYVSLEYALRHHNLIPEAVHVVTSITTGRKKRYQTPVGEFEYAPMPLRFFTPGAEYFQIDTHRGYMIASPEKAIFDMLYLRYPDLRPTEIETHLFENMRIEKSEFDRLKFSQIAQLLDTCPRRSIISFGKYLAIAKKAPHG